MQSPSMDPRDALIAELRRELAELRQQVAQLTAENQQLREQIAQLQKEGARQAAPFRRRESQKLPPAQHKRPGRPVGHAGVNRPVPDRIDATITVPLDACPQCGGAVADAQPVVQYIEEIPPVAPQVIQLTTHRGRCARCGPVASTHPLKTGAGHNASGVHLGPRALAVAALLNKQHGLSMRKTCRVLSDLCGLKLSPGGLSQSLDRLADRLQPEYQTLVADVRASPVNYADETSWWVGGPGHWLWVFTNPTTTLYQVHNRRSAAVVAEVLTPEYAGTLVSDCLNIYDTAPAASKHKCIAHHQKAIREQLDTPGLHDRTYLEAWKAFFRAVTLQWKERPRQTPAYQAAVLGFLGNRRDELLARPVTQSQDRRIQNRLEKQRPYLLTCLEKPDTVEPTNNRAERALRPAVIARKISCGNKTPRGKATWEVLTSILTTWSQRGLHLLATLTPRAGLVG